MGYKRFKWATYEDNNTSALEYNAKMIQFLADSGIEVLELNLEIRELNTYQDGVKEVRDYDGKGSFKIDENDVEKFLIYLDTFYKKLNPNEPHMLNVMLFDDDELPKSQTFETDDHPEIINDELNTEDI